MKTDEEIKAITNEAIAIAQNLKQMLAHLNVQDITELSRKQMRIFLQANLTEEEIARI